MVFILAWLNSGVATLVQGRTGVHIESNTLKSWTFDDVIMIWIEVAYALTTWHMNVYFYTYHTQASAYIAWVWKAQHKISKK